MITNLLFIITGLIGLLTALLIFRNYKSNRMMNLYMILLIIIISLRFFIGGLIYFNSDRTFSFNYLKYVNLSSVVIPLCYLYFKNLVNNKKKNCVKDLAHFIFPISLYLAIIIVESLSLLSMKLVFIIYPIFCSFTIIYFILCFKVLKNNIWINRVEINVGQKQNQLINRWATYLFIALFILSVRLLVSIFLEISNNSYARGFSYLWISAIVWLLVLFRILISPEILYGYDVLNKKINENRGSSLILKNVWKTSIDVKLSNNHHIILKEKIEKNLLVYIQKIEKQSFRYEIFRDPKLTLPDFANKLEIPKSHLSYLFKYHSTLSFSEYKKVIRIHDAIKHIELDYLKSNTLDSLSKKVGFTSYNPFFTSFKEISGVSPIEYYKTIQVAFDE
nr:AraC family transcriptional regulator [uncultured Flavobacterium sp.]